MDIKNFIVYFQLPISGQAQFQKDFKLNIFLKIGLSIIFVLAGFIVIIRMIESKSIFFPTKYPDGQWETSGLNFNIENCWLKSADGLKLHGWFIPVAGSTKVLLWFHGNAGNLSHRLDNIIMLQEVGVQQFILDYRGYGRSEGTPEEQGMYLDAEAACNFLINKKGFAPENIIIFGRSLGGGVAAELALRKPCGGLILESTFTSVGEIARKVVPFLPTTKILKNKFDTLAKIRQIRIPVLVIHGLQDELIPYENGEKIFTTANKPKYFYPVNAGHNDLYFRGGKPYLNRIKQFAATLQ